MQPRTVMLAALTVLAAAPAAHAADIFAKYGHRFTNQQIPGVEQALEGGVDDVLYDYKNSVVYAGVKQAKKIVKVDLKRKTVSTVANTPLSSAGMILSPTDPDTMYFCALRFYGDGRVYKKIPYSKQELEGVYSLSLKTGEVRPLLNYLPSLSESETVNRSFAASELESNKARQLKVCNDLDISRDGERLYFTESYQAETENGPTAVLETIRKGLHGKVWSLNLRNQKLTLLATRQSFPDGIILEHTGSGVETGVLFSELPKGRISRISLDSQFRSRGLSVAIANLPGAPDGLSRAENGEIVVSIFKNFSFVTKIASRFSTLAAAILTRLPYEKWPVPKGTGLIILDPRAERVTHNLMHDGSFVREVCAASPGPDKIFLSAFGDEASGLYWIPTSPMAKE